MAFKVFPKLFWGFLGSVLSVLTPLASAQSSDALTLRAPDVADNGGSAPLFLAFNPALSPGQESWVSVDGQTVARMVVLRGSVAEWSIRVKLPSTLSQIRATREAFGQVAQVQTRTVRVGAVAALVTPTPLRGTEDKRVRLLDGKFQMLLTAPEDLLGTIVLEDDTCRVEISTEGGWAINPVVQVHACIQSPNAIVQLSGQVKNTLANKPVRTPTMKPADTSPINRSESAVRKIQDEKPARGRSLSLN